MSAPKLLPRWADLVLLPLVGLAVALLLSGGIIALLGESPWKAMKLMVDGAFGSQDSIGYSLFYATNFIFTGLAVAVAFHAGLFNIGGEGQALWWLGAGKYPDLRAPRCSLCLLLPAIFPPARQGVGRRA